MKRFASFDYNQSRSTAGDGVLSGSFNTPVDRNALRAAVPSIFAEGAHESRSKRYGYIPTVEVLDALEAEGFRPVYAVEATPRKDRSRDGYTKHMIRFRHNPKGRASVGAIPEFLLLNSHDGSSSYKLMYGLFVALCANGLIAGDKFSEIVVPHRDKDRLVPNVVDAAYTIVRDSGRMLDAAERMKEVRLSGTDQNELAAQAIRLRFDVEKLDDAPIGPGHLLQARRAQEVTDANGSRDLWTTFNVIQENAVEGGLDGAIKNRAGAWRKTTTRPVRSIDNNVKLNRGLWTLAENFLPALPAPAELVLEPAE